MHRTVPGIEGTAWNLSAGIVTETDVLAEATATYQPKTGGIRPREAATAPCRLEWVTMVQAYVNNWRSGGNNET
ncbi:MAG: putative bifunctional tRNA threonylcarbamoyladenosine biosynthesis protein [Candidatus Methanogaster sp.]|nr:MAG: putative bifunctional tRNA threonylcarbamoyladenosine biosynthesis protein [ANME-2 cluster archaeon]